MARDSSDIQADLTPVCSVVIGSVVIIAKSGSPDKSAGVDHNFVTQAPIWSFLGE